MYHLVFGIPNKNANRVIRLLFCGGPLLDFAPYNSPVTEHVYHYLKCAYAFSKQNGRTLSEADRKLKSGTQCGSKVIVARVEERLIKKSLRGEVSM